MSYTDECRAVLQRIREENPDVPSMPYFLNTVASWHARYAEDRSDCEPASARKRPLVVVLGHGVPEQLIHACGATPYYLLGGSHASCDWSDDLVPRDSDPVSRSILGYVTRLVQQGDVDPLFVVPMVNDNLRKIAYLLKREGHAVVPVDVPPEVTSPSAQLAWERSLTQMIEAVQRHVRGRVTARSIRHANALVRNARAAMSALERTLDEGEGGLSAEAGLLVLNTYYMTDDLAQWTAMVRRLTNEVRARQRAAAQVQEDRPHVLVIGSPIMFPQFKVAELIEQAGLFLVAAVDASSTSRYASLTQSEARGNVRQLIQAIARKQYVLDSSGSHVVNTPMEEYVGYLIANSEVEGIVYHVLKGHIEYDFQLARLEELLDQYDIPVFRLETDYQYQDVEQLRIRLEAFAEMLEQRALFASRTARLRCA